MLRALLSLAILSGTGCFNSMLLTPVNTSEPVEQTVVIEAKSLFCSDKIAIIDVDGMLLNARKSGMLSDGENPVSLFRERLDKAAQDNDVKAVVLRINTPGGAVTASDIMYQDVMTFRRETNKPVVACMMDVAASGGYYLAMGCDMIYAHPTTVTGSIGVIMSMYNGSGLAKIMGVTSEAIKSGPNKDIGNPLRPMTDSERAILQAMVDKFYAQFVTVVANGRHLPEERVRHLADGRVYTGAEAQQSRPGGSGRLSRRRSDRGEGHGRHQGRGHRDLRSRLRLPRQHLRRGTAHSERDQRQARAAGHDRRRGRSRFYVPVGAGRGEVSWPMIKCTGPNDPTAITPVCKGRGIMAAANVPTSEERMKQIQDYPFVYSDGEPMDSGWAVECMHLLAASVLWLFRERTDFYVGGDMFIYFSPHHVMNRDFRGPDLFVVNGGVSLEPHRLAWVSWLEANRLPDVIFELTSPTTEHVDRTTKFQLYEQTWRTRNYFIYDQATKRLDGWELDSDQHYQPLTPNAKGRLWCAELSVWVGTWEGEFDRRSSTWPRFFDAQGNLVLTAEEAAVQRADEAEAAADETQRLADDAVRKADDAMRKANNAVRKANNAERKAGDAERKAGDAERKADDAERKADDAERKADDAKQKADDEKRRADDEKRRADAAEAELERLRNLLKQSGRGNGSTPPAP